MDDLDQLRLEELEKRHLADQERIAELEKLLPVTKTPAQKLAEIENMSYSELKAAKEDVILAATDLPSADVAARYVQARLDAKLRDQRMGEQGREITELQTQCAAMADAAVRAAGEHEVAIAELQEQRSQDNAEYLKSLAASAAALAESVDARAKVEDERDSAGAVAQEALDRAGVSLAAMQAARDDAILRINVLETAQANALAQLDDVRAELTAVIVARDQDLDDLATTKTELIRTTNALSRMTIKHDQVAADLAKKAEELATITADQAKG